MAADEAVLNIVHKKSEKNHKIPLCFHGYLSPWHADWDLKNSMIRIQIRALGFAGRGLILVSDCSAAGGAEEAAYSRSD